ncbi:uncharacterized protein LOC132757847 [Ruditapes philippinarum]|uniref:uncharacterized protein LOC132757847 n=1 Tax=Ruditapes philippinarum TaxID=129788 RepID=UPI00295AF8E6|nr:uncharacterized protein LOC132757847 [Ruditapes philippinarum]
MSQIKYAPKVVFWISLFVIVFAFVAITSDSLGYKLPVLVPDTRNASLYDFSYKKPFYVNTTSGKSTLTARNTFHKSFQNNISTTAISDMTTTLESNSRAVMKTHVAFLKVHKQGRQLCKTCFSDLVFGII